MMRIVLELRLIGGGGNNWSYKTCKAAIKNVASNKPTPTFLTGLMPILSPNSVKALKSEGNCSLAGKSRVKICRTYLWRCIGTPSFIDVLWSYNWIVKVTVLLFLWQGVSRQDWRKVWRQWDNCGLHTGPAYGICSAFVSRQRKWHCIGP